jgi:glycerol-3-phosphate dehydrogenase
MSTQTAADTQVVIIGAGVVGCATALALGRRGVETVRLEAEASPGLAASGTNSGILHTGFDSVPGELETQLIVRSAALRPAVIEGLEIPVLHCGASMRGGSGPGEADLPGMATVAHRNGVAVYLRDDRTLDIPGEAVTDPVRYTLALAAAAERHGVQLMTEQRVTGIEPGATARTADGAAFRGQAIVNCAGLNADTVARLAGDESFEIYPRKGEFLVFEPPGGEPLKQILLPVPTKRTKGVLVFPTLDGKVVAGPTAVDQADKHDWSVRPAAEQEILPKARAMYPPLEGAEPVAAYAGLRPAGRGANYVIGVSGACRQLINVAAIRSTGLTASLGIAERVTDIVRSLGVSMAAEQPLRPGPPPAVDGPWWRRTAAYRGAV